MKVGISNQCRSKVKCVWPGWVVRVRLTSAHSLIAKGELRVGVSSQAVQNELSYKAAPTAVPTEYFVLENTDLAPQNKLPFLRPQTGAPGIPRAAVRTGRPPGFRLCGPGARPRRARARIHTSPPEGPPCLPEPERVLTRRPGECKRRSGQADAVGPRRAALPR